MIITIYRETINKDKKLFKYTDKDGKIVRDKKILDYIEKLRIPPAYRDCEIFYDTAGKVLKMLFWGFDDAGRKQQIYSKEWRAKADKNKLLADQIKMMKDQMGQMDRTVVQQRGNVRRF